MPSTCYVLFYPSFIFSYVLAYFPLGFDMMCESMAVLICISTILGNSIVVDQVHQSCVVPYWGMIPG